MAEVKLTLGKGNASWRLVPPRGYSAWLTSLSAGAMAFLAVFAMVMALAAGQTARKWSSELARTATIRIATSEAQMEVQTAAVLRVLETTPGVREARVLDTEDYAGLLEPWLGPDLPLETMPLPRLIEVKEQGSGPDPDSLKLRLEGEAPDAIYDDHTRWRKPLIAAAGGLQMLALLSVVLIIFVLTTIIVLAVRAAMAANLRIIETLRLIGATDQLIVSAFVRRLTLRALLGSLVGTVLGAGAIVLLPDVTAEGGFLTGLGIEGSEWLIPVLLPFVIAMIANATTRITAMMFLRRLT